MADGLALIAVPIGAIEGASAVAAGAAAAAASTISLSTVLVGTSLAWSIGSTLFSMFGPGSSATGPRLKDVHVQSAAFGAPMKRFWGTDRMSGQIVWASKIREHAQEQGGKGGGGSVTLYTYDVDVAISIVGASKCKGIRRIWAGPKLIYDASADASLATTVASAIQLKGKLGKFFFYPGDEDQLPPAVIEAAVGVGNCPAFRNQVVCLFKNFRLTTLGMNQIPQFSFEIFSEGEELFTMLGTYTPGTASNWRAQWGYVDEQAEVYGLWWDVGTDPVGHYTSDAVHLFHWSPAGLIEELKPGDGSLSAGAIGIAQTDKLRSDELSFYAVAGGLRICYFSIATGDELVFEMSFMQTWLTAQLGSSPSTIGIKIMVKRGTDYYFYVQTASPTKGWIIKTDAGGGVIAGVHIGTQGSPGFPLDVFRSDSYLWVLTDDPALQQRDPQTLALLATFDLSSMSHGPLAGCAIDDSTIGLMVQTGTNTELCTLDVGSGTITTLATGLDGVGIPSFTDNYTLMIVNGLWYVGSRGDGGGETTIKIFGPQVNVDCIPLWKIVRDLCISAGLQENEIDVSELQDCVHGYTLESQISPRDALLPLQRTYFFDGRESDGLIDFPKRGHESVATIPQADMAARASMEDQLPPVLVSTRAQETELPVRVHVRFKDQDAAYQTGHAYSSRLISESKNVLTIDLPVAMTAQLAQRAAWVLMATHWLEREPKDIRLSRRYLALDPADPVDLELDP